MGEYACVCPCHCMCVLLPRVRALYAGGGAVARSRSMSPPRAHVYANLQRASDLARVPLGKVFVEFRGSVKHLPITRMTNRSTQEWVGMHACVACHCVCVRCCRKYVHCTPAEERWQGEQIMSPPRAPVCTLTYCMLVTLPVFHLERSPLKFVAPSNIPLPHA